MTSTQTVIYVASNVEQAHLLRAALREQGIDAEIINAPLTGAIDLGFDWAVAPRVVVSQNDADQARRIALEFDQVARGDVVTNELSDTDDEQCGQLAWPKCPSCHRRRHTSCPACGTAGTSFPQAFFPREQSSDSLPRLANAGELRVICPICDELFVPEFPACCEWCGHRFADGWQDEPPSESSEGFNERATYVIMVLVIFVAAVVGLFIYIAP